MLSGMMNRCCSTSSFTVVGGSGGLGAIALFAALAVASGASAQGVLTPPGAPAATMKTLTQIEPRADANRLPSSFSPPIAIVISQPGSYYLSAPVGSNGMGIQINASHVTLDLNGFTLDGFSSGGTGIQVAESVTDVRITNGKLRGWTFAGIWALDGLQVSVDRVEVQESGGYGIVVGSGGRVRDCSAAYVANAGIYAGPGSIVENCTVLGAATATDVTGITGGVVTDCSVRNYQPAELSTLTGIEGDIVTRCVVSDMVGTQGSVKGIFAWGSARDCAVRHLVAGFSAIGIDAGVAAGNLCTTLTSGGDVIGIEATEATGCSVHTLSTSSATGNGDMIGISARSVATCSVDYLNFAGAGAAIGVLASRVSNCSVTEVSHTTATAATGIRLTGVGSLMTESRVGGTSGTGVIVLSRGLVSGNTITRAGATSPAIHAFASGVVVRDNLVGECPVGIRSLAAGSSVYRNHVNGATTAYDLSATGQHGPVVTTLGTMASTVHPLANFAN